MEEVKKSTAPSKIELTYEAATKEVNAWLDFKRVPPRLRREKQESIKAITEAVQYGELQIDPNTFVITQVLIWPNKNNNISELKWQPRVKTKQFNESLKAHEADANDGNARIACYASVLTGVPVPVINDLDHVDSDLLKYIAVFFM